MLLVGVAIGWIHIMGAVVAVGGSFFINFVLKKASAHLSPPELGKLNQSVGAAFGPVVWIATVLIILTGVIRAGALGLLSPSVLLGSTYGNLLLAKMVLLAIIIFNTVNITRTGLRLATLATTDGVPDAGLISKGHSRIKALGMTNLALGSIAIVFAVSMRFLGAP